MGAQDDQSKKKGEIFSYAIVASMAFFFLLANGMNFAFSNFLTVFVMKSGLQMTKSVGARATLTYFGASCLMRLTSIFCVTKVPAFNLIILNLFLIFAGDTILIAFGDSNLIIFMCGVVLLGLGISALFPYGIIWLRENTNLTSKITSIHVLAASVGAQCFKIPIACWIEKLPMSLMYSMGVASLASLLTFVISILLIKKMKQNETIEEVGSEEEVNMI